MSPSPDALALDRQNPWPGLATYDEASQAFFFGRDDETAELLRLVRVAPLTILYSASGLGKSSLLLAGLFPRLRAEHYLPVHLRLDFSETAQSGPLEQALRRLEEEIVSAGAEATARKADEDLWRYLHRGDFELWSADNFPLVPVLVFDQFEELFSRGAAREHVAGVLDALADLVENRTPPELVRDDVAGREALRRFDLRTQRYRVVLSFREEFLPEIVGWKKIPSLLNNALQLLPMSRQKAIAATELAGRDVLAAGVAERIVDLHPPTRQHYYHPAMQGSWSLKAVIPTVAPELRYSALGEVRDGLAAQSAYFEAIAPATAEPRRAELKKALLDYCRQDTLALARLVEFFSR